MVVCVGETDLEVRFVTEPMPLSIDKEVAPETVQDKAEDCPEVMEAGEALKTEITGAPGALMVTVTVAVAEPPLLVAVRI